VLYSPIVLLSLKIKETQSYVSNQVTLDQSGSAVVAAMTPEPDATVKALRHNARIGITA
jgi:hypothetical protein